MINYSWLIFFLFNVIHGLRWNSSGKEFNNDMIISLRSSVSNIKIDLHQKEQIIVLRDIDSSTIPIQLYCFIAGYNEDNDITFEFCKDVNCLVKVNDNVLEQSSVQYGMKIKIQTKFPNGKGMGVEFTLPSDDSSGNYYCKVTENTGDYGYLSIRSNNVQIRDIIYWEENLVTNNDNIITTNTNVFTHEKLPFVFNCSMNPLIFHPRKPEWVDEEFVSPVLWSVCPVMKDDDKLTVEQKMSFRICVTYTTTKWVGHSDVLRPKDITEMVKWNSYVNRQGELIIFDMEHTPDMTYTLMCYKKKKGRAIPINTYVSEYDQEYIKKGIEFNPTTVNPNMGLLSKSPKLQYVDIYARKGWPSQLDYKMKVAIYAKYSAPKTAKVTWLYNDHILSERANLKTDQYKVIFIGDIKSDISGNYTLFVEDKGKYLTITKMITIVGSPTIKNPGCLPQFQPVMEGANISLICHYEDDPDELIFQINNNEVKPNDPITKSELQNSYAYLTDFNFNVSVIKNTATHVWTMKYNAFQLRKSKGQTKYQDHSITFKVKNKYGLSVRSTSIYVVPNVESQILEFPHSLNCTPFCKSSESHDFKCRFNQNEYKHKEVNIEHYWTVEGHRLDRNNSRDNSFAPYFKVNPVTKDLHLMAINSSDSKRDVLVRGVLKSTSLVCRIDIAYYSDSKQNRLYYSNLDTNLSQKLSVQLKFDMQPSSSFTTWIVLAILGILAIIILAAIIYYRKKPQGDTYLLEKLEEKHGHDRDKELEKQKFKPYQYKNKHHDTDSIHSDVELNNETDDYVV